MRSLPQRARSRGSQRKVIAFLTALIMLFSMVGLAATYLYDYTEEAPADYEAPSREIIFDDEDADEEAEDESAYDPDACVADDADAVEEENACEELYYDEELYYGLESMEAYQEIVALQTVTVTDLAELQAALGNLLPAVQNEIILASPTGYIETSAVLVIPTGMNVVITGGQELRQTGGVRHFLFESGGSQLTLQDVILCGVDSANVGGGITILNGNTLIMNAPSVIRNSQSNASHGGGVLINHGTFTMNGGTIENNIASGRGGGVSVNSTPQVATFNMNGGTIQNNAAGEVGGGVCVAGNSSTFAMGTATIHNNQALLGGGVNAIGNANFTINGGTISNNDAEIGAGILLDGNDLLMVNGTITANTGVAMGGGVLIYDGIFTMQNGTISNNSASNGGGVDVAYGEFIVHSGSITNNAAIYGGGIYVTFGGTLTMHGGAVTNNTAVNDGGGIFTDEHTYSNPLPAGSYPNLTIAAAVNFSGNTAGNGIYVEPDNYYIITAFDGLLLNNYNINYRSIYTLVVFDLNTGNVAGNTDNVEVVVLPGNTVGINNVPVPVRAGYIFLGWAREGVAPILTSVAVGDYVVEEPVTFVAQWEPIEQPPVDDTRPIRVYYYLEGYGLIVNNTITNTPGREYTGVVSSPFLLIGVQDRNTIGSANTYVFEGWEIYVAGQPNPTYLPGLVATQLNGNSFNVPAAANADSQLISLLAVWSIYEAEGPIVTPPPPPPPPPPPGAGAGVGGKALPSTGIESSIILWSVLLAITTLVCTGIFIQLIDPRKKMAKRRSSAK